MRIERTASLGSLLLSSSLLALGACGDDSTADGTAGATATESADTTAGTPMTTTEAESVDTTATPPETTDTPMTTDAETTTGESTTDDPPPGGAAAFRFNTIELRDPAGGLGGACNNPDMVNGLLAPALAEDGDGDGFLDMAFVLNFPLLDQSDGASGDIEFANAQCAVPDGQTCGLLPSTTLSATTYSALAKGICLEPDPAVIDASLPEPAGSTTGPCFVTEAIDATVVTSSVSIPLSSARIAARFVGDPAGNLVEGTIQGFLTQADAQATMVDIPVLGAQPLANLLCADHLDDGGWWMHMAFTAVTTDWSG